MTLNKVHFNNNKSRANPPLLSEVLLSKVPQAEGADYLKSLGGSSEECSVVSPYCGRSLREMILMRKEQNVEGQIRYKELNVCLISALKNNSPVETVDCEG